MVVLTLLAALLSVQLPDVHKGVINGKAAVLVMPRFGGEIVEPADCSAHLVRHVGPGPELTYPCGQWFQPPPGMYRLWLEKGDLITPTPDLLVWNGGPFTDKGLGDIVDLVVGGRVQLGAQTSVVQNAQLGLVHVDSHFRLGRMGRAFERFVPSGKAHDGVLMPAGRVVPFIADDRGNVVTVFRPVSVPEHGRVVIEPRTDRESADVFLKIQRPRAASDAHPDRITVALSINDRAVPPNVFIETADRSYAVWYAVTAPRARLVINSEALAPVSDDISLKARSVTTISKALQVRPAVKVSVVAPERILNEPKSLDIFNESRTKIRHIEPIGSETVVEALPLEKLTFQLNVPKWHFERDVDLTGGDDHAVLFELQPITISGTVFHGSKPVESTVRFYIAPEWEESQTDSQGNYEITLWEPRMYPVEIKLAGVAGAPYRDYFVNIDRSERHDFHVPDTHFTLHVSDADSGNAIQEAEVAVINSFTADGGGEQRATLRIATDSTGTAVLPPLRPGTVTLIARAKSYRDGEPLILPVTSDSEEHAFNVQLHPETSETTIRVILPSGAPATSADLLATPSTGSDAILWRATADDSGNVDVPRRINGALVIVKHPSGAACLRIFDVSDPNVSWQLQALAPSFVVKATDAAGAAVPFADVIMWLDDIALRGNALRFLTGTPAVTDQNGIWDARNLFPGPVDILVRKGSTSAPVRQLAQTVPFPWPSLVALRIIAP